MVAGVLTFYVFYGRIDITVQDMPDKRINMDIDRELWRQAKKCAIDRNISLREWIAEAVRNHLTQTNSETKKE